MGLGKKMSKILAGDLVYSVGGLVCMNGVLQLLMYPFLEKNMGQAAFGNVQTLLAVISILATTFGSGASYSRMVSKMKEHDCNGDYNIYLAVASLISVVIAAITVHFTVGAQGVLYHIGFALLTVFSILRYYGDVEYRLNVNFKGFFIYYLLISLGYVAGTLIYPLSNSWIFAVLAGELACFVYVTAKGSIFSGKDVFRPSENFGDNIRSMVILSLTNLINALVLHSDKLLLRAMVSAEAVTVFYVATLIGKIIAMLTTPLNGIIIGYLTKFKGKFSAKLFGAVIAVALGIGAVFIFGGFIVSHLFVGIMYPDVYETAKPLFLTANAGQVFYFISGSLMVVVLRFIEEKYQLIINTVYAIIFALVVIPFVYFLGLWGIAYGLLIVNVLRFVIVAAFGFRELRRPAKK